MHEYSIVQALYDSVIAHAGARAAPATVQEVRVRIGELSGVDVGLLDTAWRTFRVRTLCEDAAMEIETVAPALGVPGVPARGAPRGGVRRCPACGGPLRLAEGDEIVLDRIVMEVP